MDYFSNAVLSEVLGVNPYTFQTWKKGGSAPTFLRCFHMAKVLGVSFYEVYSDPALFLDRLSAGVIEACIPYIEVTLLKRQGIIKYLHKVTGIGLDRLQKIVVSGSKMDRQEREAFARVTNIPIKKWLLMDQHDTRLVLDQVFEYEAPPSFNESIFY